MKNYIEALKEIKKESKDFKITLSRKEVLEITKEFDRLNNIINETNKMIDKIVEEVYKPVDKEWDNILCIIEDYKLKLQELKGSDEE